VPTINLNADERAALNEPLAGQGGFQTLLKRLRSAVQPNGELELTDSDVATIRQYRTEYGVVAGRSASIASLRGPSVRSRRPTAAASMDPDPPDPTRCAICGRPVLDLSWMEERFPVLR